MTDVDGSENGAPKRLGFSRVHFVEGGEKRMELSEPSLNDGTESPNSKHKRAKNNGHTFNSSPNFDKIMNHWLFADDDQKCSEFKRGFNSSGGGFGCSSSFTSGGSNNFTMGGGFASGSAGFISGSSLSSPTRLGSFKSRAASQPHTDTPRNTDNHTSSQPTYVDNNGIGASIAPSENLNEIKDATGCKGDDPLPAQVNSSRSSEAPNDPSINFDEARLPLYDFDTWNERPAGEVSSATKNRGTPIVFHNIHAPTSQAGFGHFTTSYDKSGGGSAGFKLASGKDCTFYNRQKLEDVKDFLGLDDLDFENSCKSTPKIGDVIKSTGNTPKVKSTSVERGCEFKFFYRSKTTTDKALDMEGASKITSYIDLWNNNCLVTEKQITNINEALLLWDYVGNPFTICYNNVLEFKFIRFSHLDETVTIGGLDEISKCFQQILLKYKCEFNQEWLCKKYELYSLVLCRNYRKKVYKLMKAGYTFMDSVSSVSLPDPIKLIRLILKSHRREFVLKQKSIINGIYQGKVSPDLSLVVRVEDVDEDMDTLYVTDGYELFKAVITDEYVRNLLRFRKITNGSRLRLHGIFTSTTDDQINLNISYNTISNANRSRVGKQKKHINVNIRDLRGDGRVLKLDVVVLRRLPISYKITYHCLETHTKRTVVLSEAEYDILFSDPNENLLGIIETISMYHTFIVVDSITLLKHQLFEQLDKTLLKSTSMLIFKNADSHYLSKLKPMTRISLTNVYIRSLMNDESLRNYNFSIFTNTFSKVDIVKDLRHLEIYQFLPSSNEFVNNLLLYKLPFSFNARNLFTDDSNEKEEDSLGGMFGFGKGNCTKITITDNVITMGDRVIYIETGNSPTRCTTTGSCTDIFGAISTGFKSLESLNQDEDKIMADINKSIQSVEFVFYEMLKEYPKVSSEERLFYGQFCDITGVLLYIGDIVSVDKCISFRLFIQTTSLHLVSIKITSRDIVIQDKGNNTYKLKKAIEMLKRKLSIILINPNNHLNHIIYQFSNIQYEGYDKHCNVHNFTTQLDKFQYYKSSVLSSVQGVITDVLNRKNYKIMGSSMRSVLVSLYIRILLSDIIRVHELVHESESNIEVYRGMYNKFISV